MRMRNWAGAAVLAVAAVAAPARAAEPTVEVRVRSVNDLIERFEYVAGLAGQEEAAKQAKDAIASFADPKAGIEGVDPKRPFGAYATVTADVATSPVVGMIPIADKDRFLKMLADRAGVTPEKADGGALKFHLPFLGEPLFGAFANDYLYLSPSEKAVAEKELVAPKAFFAKDDGSVVSVVARLDRVPSEVKGFVLGQMELQLQQARKNAAGQKGPYLKGAELGADTAAGAVKTLLDDAKELSLKVNIDPKGDDLTVELALSAKDGSTLAKNIAAMGKKTSRAAGIAGGADAVARGGMKLEMTPEMKERFGKAVDDLFAEGLKGIEANQRSLAQRVFKALAPTVKAGELDLAASFTGPDAKGKYGLIAAVGVKEGKGIEQLVKDLSAFVPGGAVEFTFDAGTAGEFTLHKVELTGADANFEKVFGTKTLWLATSADCYAVSVEADGAALKKALAAKPVPTPVLAVEVSAAKLVPLVGSGLKPDELKAALKDAFGDGAGGGNDRVALTVTGGERLTVKLTGKGKAVRLAAAMSQLLGK